MKFLKTKLNIFTIIWNFNVAFCEFGKIDHQRFHNFLSANTESFLIVMILTFLCNLITSVLNEVCPLITSTMRLSSISFYGTVMWSMMLDVKGANANGRKVSQKWMKNNLECRRNCLTTSQQILKSVFLLIGASLQILKRCIAPSTVFIISHQKSYLILIPSMPLFLTFSMEKVENTHDDVSS